MTTVFEEFPFAYVLDDGNESSYCHYCCTESQHLLRCSKCKFAHYCDRNCQLAAHKDHAEECDAAKKTYPLVPSRQVRMMIRVLVELKRNPEQLERNNGTGERTFAMLKSHAHGIKKSSDGYAKFVETLAVLTNVIDKKYIPSNRNFLLEIYGKCTINALNLSNSRNGKSIGLALYLQMCGLSHSCDPGAVIVYSGPKAVLNLIKPELRDVDWKTLTISFVDLYMSLESRKQVLRADFFVACHCRFCKEDTLEERLRNAVMCPYPGCGGPVIRKELMRLKPKRGKLSSSGQQPVVGVCHNCGREISDISASLMKVDYVEKARAEIESKRLELSASDAFERSFKVMEEVADAVHPFNVSYSHILFRIYSDFNCMSKLSGEQKQWLRKQFPDYIAGVRIGCYGIPLPQIVHRFLTLSEAALEFDKVEFLDHAKLYIDQAAEMAKITYGENHPIFDKINEVSKLVEEKRKRAF